MLEVDLTKTSKLKNLQKKKLKNITIAIYLVAV